MCVSKGLKLCAKKLSTHGDPIAISIHSSSSTRPPSASMITSYSTVPLLSRPMAASFCSYSSDFGHSYLPGRNLQSEAVVNLHPLLFPQTPPPPYSYDPPPPYVVSIT
jgi:hypothetical protein